MTSAAMCPAGETGSVVSATIHVDPADPVFAGHYPGFPILPGLYLVEYVHRLLSTVDGMPPVRLVALDRARFHRPVRPGDELRVDATRSAGGDELHCTATVSTEAGSVAEIRLRYRRRMPGDEP